MPLLRVAAAALIAFGLDQFSKLVIVPWIGLTSGDVVNIRPPYLIFRMVWNKGINFGFFRSYDSRWVLVLAAVVISLSPGGLGPQRTRLAQASGGRRDRWRSDRQCRRPDRLRRRCRLHQHELLRHRQPFVVQHCRRLHLCGRHRARPVDPKEFAAAEAGRAMSGVLI